MNEPPIMVLSTCTNAEAWIAEHVRSVIKQRERNFHRLIIDGPTDRSSFIASDTVDQAIHTGAYGHQASCTFITHHRERGQQMAHVWEEILTMHPESIVAWVDGDDWLSGPDALTRVRQAYRNPDVWMTWGSFNYANGTEGWASDYPAEIRANSAFRSDIWRATHLKTFRAGLFQQIKALDLTKDGWDHEWVSSAVDLATMFPMLEMAQERSLFIPDPLYVYSGANCATGPGTATWAEAQRIRAMPRYSRLNERPW